MHDLAYAHIGFFHLKLCMITFSLYHSQRKKRKKREEIAPSLISLWIFSRNTFNVVWSLRYCFILQKLLASPPGYKISVIRVSSLTLFSYCKNQECYQPLAPLITIFWSSTTPIISISPATMLSLHCCLKKELLLLILIVSSSTMLIYVLKPQNHLLQNCEKHNDLSIAEVPRYEKLFQL